MTANDFYRNRIFTKLIKALKQGINIGDINRSLKHFLFHYNDSIKAFKLITAKDEKYILDILDKEYNDIYRYLLFLHGGENLTGNSIGYYAITRDIMEYILCKYYPESILTFITETQMVPPNPDQKLTEKLKRIAKSLTNIYERYLKEAGQENN